MTTKARWPANAAGLSAATAGAVVHRRRRGLVTIGGRSRGRRGTAASGRSADRIDPTALSAARVLVARLGAAVDPRALVEALSENRELDRSAKDFISTHSGITHVGGSQSATGSEPIRAGLQPKEVAAMLGVDKSTVSRYTRSGKLYAIDVDGRHRYPPWQFVSSQPLPGVGTVVRALPDGWGPVPFARFMSTPDEALGGHSPVEWLTAGGTAQRVVTLLEEEARA